MKKIQEKKENKLVIDKSIFITTLIRVNSIEEVNEALLQIRKKYYDATHNCYAYILGEQAEIQKCSDDGEPSKTAGYPMLDVLKKNEITDILAVVTRYFGGTLLGAGGLVRAYSSSISKALEGVTFYKLISLEKLQINVSYSNYNLILTYLNSFLVLETSFTSEVLILVAVPLEIKTNFITKINDLCAGNSSIIELGVHQIESSL